MELTIIFIIIVIIGVIYQVNKNKVSNASIEALVGVGTGDKRTTSRDDRFINTGQLIQITATRYCLNNYSPLPITLNNLSIENAEKIKSLFNAKSAGMEANLDEITYLFAQNNIECLELNAYLQKAKTEINAFINNKKTESNHWQTASDEEKQKLLSDFQSQAIEFLHERPANRRALRTLLFNSPTDVTEGHELLKRFSDKMDLYPFYIHHLGRAAKLATIPADSDTRSQWESLAKHGLALRGQDIPADIILNGLRMKDINDFFTDRLEKKFTRKAQAVDFAMSQNDLFDVLALYLSLDDLFCISEPENMDVAKIKKCYEYAVAKAEIVKDTYVTSYKTIKAIQKSKDAHYTGWEIETDRCCPECGNLEHKTSTRLPTHLPPYHVGCTCEVRGVVD